MYISGSFLNTFPLCRSLCVLLDQRGRVSGDLAVMGAVFHLERSEHEHFLVCAVDLLQQNAPAGLLIQLCDPHRIILTHTRAQTHTHISYTHELTSKLVQYKIEIGQNRAVGYGLKCISLYDSRHKR